ncbi:GNAT family N-acetyltransferase [Serratia aquatilis]|uniref:GNAT family N-acetyltransferase n=1 Tax=Serratia aquatilis TaxID=1737515 RepID=A0ABV6EIV2_9GAMM
MELYKQLVFERVSEKDVDELTNIMRCAFDEDTWRHLGKKQGGPPGYDDGEFIRQWYIETQSDAYKISLGGTLIGGVNIFVLRDKERFLGSLFIAPSVQDKGLGLQVWEFLEQKYPDTQLWQTETPEFSCRNHHFYINKCGFKLIRFEHHQGEEHRTMILEKRQD